MNNDLESVLARYRNYILSLEDNWDDEGSTRF